MAGQSCCCRFILVNNRKTVPFLSPPHSLYPDNWNNVAHRWFCSETKAKTFRTCAEQKGTDLYSFPSNWKELVQRESARMAFLESLEVHTEGHVFAGFWRSELKGHIRRCLIRACLLKTRPLEGFEGFPLHKCQVWFSAVWSHLKVEGHDPSGPMSNP